MTKPVYVYDEESINAHFLTYFIVLTITGLVQKKINRKYSPAVIIIDCLNKIERIHEDENIFLFGFRSAVSELLGDMFGVDFLKKRLRLASVKNILASAKI
jgi:hypothetical protein